MLINLLLVLLCVKTELTLGIEAYVSYLMGGHYVEVDLPSPVKARALAYVIEGGRYHRSCVVKEILLMFKGDKLARSAAWQLIQELPVSHLLYIPDHLDLVKKCTRSLRHAVVVKLANTLKDELLRAFALEPEAFRRLFKVLRLPKTVFHGKKIVNENYLFAASLSESSLKKVVEEYGVEYLLKISVPLHTLVNFITAENAKTVAEHASPQSFLEHARLFLNLLGEEKFNRIAVSKIHALKDPLKFIGVLEHLIKTGVPEEVVDLIDKRIREYLEELKAKYRLSYVIIVVDVSGSMEAALETTSKLYPILSKFSDVDIVVFNDTAWKISPSELEYMKPDGMTSIGAGLLKAYEVGKGREVSAVVLITDFDENTPPFVKEVFSDPKVREFFEKTPIAVVLVGSYVEPRDIPTPYATLRIRDFHPRLVSSILVTIFKAVESAKTTKFARKPVSSEVMNTPLPQRPEETLKPGYLEKVLTNEA